MRKRSPRELLVDRRARRRAARSRRPAVVSPTPTRSASTSDAVGARRPRRTRRVELARRRDEAHLQLAGAPALADDEVAQEARLRAAVVGAEALRAAPVEHLRARRVDALGGQQASRRSDRCRSHEPGAWKPQTSLAVRAPCRRSTRACCGSATARSAGTIGSSSKPSSWPMPRQRVGDLLVLDLELALVGQHLPRRAGVVGDRPAMRSGLGSRISTTRASA